MSAQTFSLEGPPTGGAVPFASEFVTLTKQEHIELMLQAHYFKSMHQRALARSDWREARLLGLLHQMKKQGAQREVASQVVNIRQTRSIAMVMHAKA